MSGGCPSSASIDWYNSSHLDIRTLLSSSNSSHCFTLVTPTLSLPHQSHSGPNRIGAFESTSFDNGVHSLVETVETCLISDGLSTSVYFMNFGKRWGFGRFWRGVRERGPDQTPTLEVELRGAVILDIVQYKTILS